MEKKVSVKLTMSEALVLCKFVEMVCNTKARTLDMNAKHIIVTNILIRKRMLTQMIEHKKEYIFRFPAHEALGLFLATQSNPSVKCQVDNQVIDKVAGLIHQKMV